MAVAREKGETRAGVMGLMTGEYGPKSVLRARFNQSFREYATLQVARDATGHVRDDTVALMDGNVIMMGVPDACATFDAYLGVVYNSVRAALRAGRVVVVAFDEPDHVPDAKRAEQARRDAETQSKKPQASADLAPTVDDTFTQEELERMTNVPELKSGRPARVKLYDALAMAVFHRAQAAMQLWVDEGYDPGALVLDGVDVRGAHRRPHERREPTMIATDPALVGPLAHAQPVGEGDMKLPILEQRVRELGLAGHAYFERTRLIITATTDTDALAICVMDAAQRRAADAPSGSEEDGKKTVHSLLMMKERSHVGASSNDDVAPASRFTTVDTVQLEDHLQRYMWGGPPSGSDGVRAAYAFVAACAMPKCDFVKFAGARFDHFLEELPRFVKQERQRALTGFDSAVCADDHTALQRTSLAVRALCEATADCMLGKPRYKKQAIAVREAPTAHVARIVWVLGYWAKHERKDCVRFGFDPVPRSAPRAPANCGDVDNPTLAQLLVESGGCRDPTDGQYKWDREPVEPVKSATTTATAVQPLNKRLCTVGAGMGECECTPPRQLPLATRCTVCGRYAFNRCTSSTC